MPILRYPSRQPGWFGLFLLAACLACVSVAAEENPDYNARIWRTEDGLPNNSVHAMAQSPEGYLWIGTRHGLARFDGVHFKTVPGLEEVSIT
ncbi:MAG TPA: two-component regulator propeller domain-containing protein, partial [Candidatus Saccharimonadales bacterium]|nr:two-component regulator propeller domain-containing protein [Candidatus Saccharimonadales bacterium]